VITAVLGAPGSGKSTLAQPLAALLPTHVVLDWDIFMEPAAALAGRQIVGHPETWPAYRELIGAVVSTIAHLPVVLLTVCTPDELPSWPIDVWVLLDCSDQERRQRLAKQASQDRLAEGIHDAAEDRSLGLPVIDTTGHTPAEVAADLARFVLRLEQGDRETDLAASSLSGCRFGCSGSAADPLTCWPRLLKAAPGCWAVPAASGLVQLRC
jgi:energy-coupling factor transporter ATP-binding protein EcfA2